MVDHVWNTASDIPPGLATKVLQKVRSDMARIV